LKETFKLVHICRSYHAVTALVSSALEQSMLLLLLLILAPVSRQLMHASVHSLRCCCIDDSFPAKVSAMQISYRRAVRSYHGETSSQLASTGICRPEYTTTILLIPDAAVMEFVNSYHLHIYSVLLTGVCLLFRFSCYM